MFSGTFNIVTLAVEDRVVTVASSGIASVTSCFTASMSVDSGKPILISAAFFVSKNNMGVSARESLTDLAVLSGSFGPQDISSLCTLSRGCDWGCDWAGFKVFPVREERGFGG